MITRIDEFKKNQAKLIRENVEAENSFLEEMQAKLNNTNDLWEVDKIGAKLEEMGRDANIGQGYGKYHRELVPAWIDKHWGKDMLYKKENLFEFLYKKW